ncbi:glycosyltransferase family 2 protein [Saccharothrix yanglingensis]|uniref:glycosyltransferase family 2 protein n=1 Tax=Saccharothrix yanglingensis TaxID=659496 RepID=UPI0027D3194D|nr:glycosyltransferase family 2 protein [Saccharothrix yanglingensis]
MTSRSKSLDSGPGLSVVMPVFNEQDWIEKSIEALRIALDKAAWPAEILVVDDGSTDETPQRLARTGVTVLTQPNRGRFAARQAGIEAARGERVLLLDSRVLIDPEALVHLKQQLREHPERVVWNGHVNVQSAGNPYGGFWAGLVAVAWRRYLADPRPVSFGAEEFDLFPKGTGFFCAPRAMLVEAASSFSSLFEDVRLASDDTRMLRWVAERERIHLSPDFSATYHSRDSLKKFVRHAYFRGTTFVDGYLDSPGPARTAAFVAGGVGLAGLVVLVKRPKTALALLAAGSAAAGAVSRKSGATASQAGAVARLMPLFAACFGSGVLRGLVLTARKALATRGQGR